MEQGQGQWERGLNLATNKSLSERCNCHKNTNLEPENWCIFLFSLLSVYII